MRDRVTTTYFISGLLSPAVLALAVTTNNWDAFELWALLGAPWLNFFKPLWYSSHSMSSCLNEIFGIGTIGGGVFLQSVIGYVVLLTLQVAFRSIFIGTDGKFRTVYFNISLASGAALGAAVLSMNWYALKSCQNGPLDHQILVGLHVFAYVTWSIFSSGLLLAWFVQKTRPTE